MIVVECMCMCVYLTQFVYPSTSYITNPLFTSRIMLIAWCGPERLYPAEFLRQNKQLKRQLLVVYSVPLYG
jgi:hypothetical protein